jgi:hypothetical protein
VSLFRRREPLHVRLAREGGLDVDEKETTPVPWDQAGIHGMQRARRWDAVTVFEAPDVGGEKLEFVALAGRIVPVEGEGDPATLAAALERELARPYRAEAVRREGGLWAVAARRIEVVRLPGVSGEEIELAAHGDERTLRVDGEQVFGTIPALERPDHVVLARRIDGEDWEVETAPL